MQERSLQLKRKLMAAAILPGLFAVAACEKKEAASPPKHPKATETVPTVAPSTPEEQITVPFIAASCLKFAVRLEVGQGHQIADPSGSYTYFAENVGVPAQNQYNHGLAASRLAVKHVLPNGKEAHLTSDAYQGMDAVFADGSSAHFYVAPVASALEASGWTCRPEPGAIQG